MVDSLSVSEVVKCVQIGLLCIHQRPEDRPTMSFVVLMLDSVSVVLPQTKHPGFYPERISNETESFRVEKNLITNELTNTLSQGR